MVSNASCTADLATKTTFYVEWLKEKKLKYTFYTKKASKKNASVIRFLHLCNFCLFRGLEYLNETNVEYRHGKLIELVELIEQVLQNIYWLQKRIREKDALFSLQWD